MKDPEGPEEVYIGYDDLDQEYKDLVERAIKMERKNGYLS